MTFLHSDQAQQSHDQLSSQDHLTILILFPGWQSSLLSALFIDFKKKKCTGAGASIYVFFEGLKLRSQFLITEVSGLYPAAGLFTAASLFNLPPPGDGLPSLVIHERNPFRNTYIIMIDQCCRSEARSNRDPPGQFHAERCALPNNLKTV